MNLSDYLKEALAKHVGGVAAYTMPTTVYLALCSTATSDAALGTELTGNGYSRQAVTFAWDAGNVWIENSALVRFTASGGTLGGAGATHYALMDASTGGNMLAHNAFGSTQTVADGQRLDFDPAAITLAFDYGV